MRILYCALDQTVPGTKGGSVHVASVAEGLAALRAMPVGDLGRQTTANFDALFRP